MGSPSQGPPDKPGYQVIALNGDAVKDSVALNNLAIQGFRLVLTYSSAGGTIFAVLEWGYDKQNQYHDEHHDG